MNIKGKKIRERQRESHGTYKKEREERDIKERRERLREKHRRKGGGKESERHKRERGGRGRKT